MFEELAMQPNHKYIKVGLTATLCFFIGFLIAKLGYEKIGLAIGYMSVFIGVCAVVIGQISFFRSMKKKNSNVDNKNGSP